MPEAILLATCAEGPQLVYLPLEAMAQGAVENGEVMWEVEMLADLGRVEARRRDWRLRFQIWGGALVFGLVVGALSAWWG